MERRTIKIIGACVAIGGTAISAAVLVFALSADNAKPRKLASADIGQLADDHYMTVDTEALRYFIVRRGAKDIRVIAAPLEDAKIPMPETHWWKPIVKCKDFRLGGDGARISDTSRFACHDADQPPEWAKRWQWTLDGRHVPDEQNFPMEDLYRVRIERSGDEIVFVMLEPD